MSASAERDAGRTAAETLAAAGSSSPDRRGPRSPRASLIAVSLALFCIQLDFFGLNLAIPAITRTLHASTDQVQWTISGYMLSLGSLFILGGRLGDILGRRPMLLLGIGIFGAASALCALAPNLGLLIGFRVLAGAGAALIFPVGIAVITNAYDDRRRARALGLTFAIANVGTAAGPFVGGGLAQGPGWRWVFWALVPVCAVSFALSLVGVGDSRDPSASRRVDYPGAVLLVAGIASLSYAVDRGGAWGWTSTRTLGLLLAGAALLIAFLWNETRVRHPLVDLSLFRNLSYVLVTTLGAVTNIGYGVMVFVITLYLQGVRHLSPLLAGVLFLAPATLVALAGPVGARLKAYLRPTVIMAAAALIGAGSLVALTFATSYAVFVPLFALAGFGFGLGWTFANVATQDVVDTDRAGEASGVLLTVLVAAGGFGLALIAGGIASLERGGHPPESAYFISLRIIATLTVAWAALVMGVRAILARRGLMAPLSMRAPSGYQSPGTSRRVTR